MSEYLIHTRADTEAGTRIEKLLYEALDATLVVRDALSHAIATGRASAERALWIDQDETLADRLDLVVAELTNRRTGEPQRRALLTSARQTLVIACLVIELGQRTGQLPRNPPITVADGTDLLIFLETAVQRIQAGERGLPL